MALGKMMGLGGNPAYDAFDSRRNALMGFGAGLMSGNLGNAGLYAMQGRQQDDAFATQQKAEAERQEQLNQTVQWLQQSHPDLAQMVSSGMPVQEAWGEALRRQQPAPEPDYPTSYDEFLLGQQNPEYAATLNQPGQVINNNIGGSDKFYDTMDAKLADQTAALIDSGMNAQSNNIRLGELEKLLGPGGAPQGAQGVMVQAAGALGIPTEGLDDVQAAQALISQMVPGQRPPGSGTMSDADLALFKASLPQIINQPGGNQKILQTMKAVNEYTIELARIAQQVANREISPAEGRAMQAAVPNPLANFKAPPAGGTQPGATRLRFNPATGLIE